MNIKIPRIVIGGTGSGVGKTTIALALTQILRKKGLKVATFKCGPDYLDPTYHSRASQKICHNLDGWLMGKESVLNTFYQACHNVDIAIIEGMMGLFDGHSPNSEIGSTAEIAKWLASPVLVVLDTRGMARTVSAILKGLKIFDPDLNLAGAFANFTGSLSHIQLLKDASTEVPILGGLCKHSEQTFPERHLGLYSASEENVSEEKFNFWGEEGEKSLEVNSILEIANSAPEISIPVSNINTTLKRCKIGIAMDSAFHFYYEENLMRLRQAGAELVFFSPLSDSRLTDVDGLYFGGGYPEVFAPTLSKNKSLLNYIRDLSYKNIPIYAECGGLMYLSKGIKLVEGEFFPMLGLISATSIMEKKLKALGYVEVTTKKETIFGEVGLRFRGHQFRYSDLELDESNPIELVYNLRKRKSDQVSEEGYSKNSILASYIHAHWASNPSLAEGFVQSCLRK
ncbi:cobyrinic acid a,c-diamide synthase [Leptospira interrogans serovar Grippotyphosa str. UI 12769]|uniref:cobyrinate a,c-diamide synthase n=2 Tax=Leptospira interrogans TaxID=173 RepID=UPI0002929E2D|nr:cobyrinate a,c-diamide synthase [Leptospira interrogans]EKO86878.1 cobyrinic acid a,c-diamide synthase [Leptospira interrogans serovar Grippotyphosa str. Andaman]EKP83163.1 cobyrinic acid a,c-diamide synthase [Leptospira interrogans serovar Grippotyphosa str. 2006006986]EKR44336.1 cobyrinic acid a,c-diamide synthase [Leptospira interrogans serovar Grippotyphosa str. UI 08368]EMN54388.1 cobyrinic acid a,c-diamide synthase [Leptospira interrogans serovar Autumnalis str. LP101]EMN85010.1 cobyr